MKTYFKFRESSNKGWTIGPVWEEFWTEGTMIKGSFNLLICRVAGLSWPQWLRFCRQHGATLYGKGCKYIMAVWDKPDREFEAMMNKRANDLAKLINLKELHL